MNIYDFGHKFGTIPIADIEDGGLFIYDNYIYIKLSINQFADTVEIEHLRHNGYNYAVCLNNGNFAMFKGEFKVTFVATDLSIDIDF